MFNEFSRKLDLKNTQMDFLDPDLGIFSKNCSRDHPRYMASDRMCGVHYHSDKYCLPHMEKPQRWSLVRRL